MNEITELKIGTTTPTKKSLNSNLHKSKTGKNDEFYTQLTDIEKELKHYKTHFKGKTVFCNCDDPKVSNFFRYFFLKFHEWELKKLIATCYRNDNPDFFSQNKNEKAVYLDFDGTTPNTLEALENMPPKELSGNGDFRSKECIEFLKEADIVVTNPPFSLFREYVAQLVEYNKKFLIIGHQNAITYKEIFHLIKENKIWLGVDNGGTKWFAVKDHYDITTESRKKIENGQKFFSMGSVVWFTNLDHSKRNEKIIPYKTYSGNEIDYPYYDNYDAINVDKVAEIPADYTGVMGVPITFLDKYNPEQFEIIKFRKGNDEKDLSINGKCPYFRILIKNKEL